MRQPERITITPSAPCDWYGGWAEGQRFSEQQRYQMRERGIDETTVEAITVKRKATMREMYWPTGTPAPVFEFECPVIGTVGADRVKIISPAGINRIVFADGSIRKPRRRAA